MVPTTLSLTSVILLARAPRLGRVKTRLAADVGDQRALEIYRRLGSGVVRQIAPVASITVWFDPPDALDEMRAWLGDCTYRPQPEGDLGVRLAHAFAEHFANNPGEPAVAVGTDAPGVDAGVIAEASRALRGAEVVIGPASDGGYYLIGRARFHGDLFVGIPWGTERVFETTAAASAAVGVDPVIMRELRDVDRAADLPVLDERSP